MPVRLGAASCCGRGSTPSRPVKCPRRGWWVSRSSPLSTSLGGDWQRCSRGAVSIRSTSASLLALAPRSRSTGSPCSLSPAIWSAPSACIYTADRRGCSRASSRAQATLPSRALPAPPFLVSRLSSSTAGAGVGKSIANEDQLLACIYICCKIRFTTLHFGENGAEATWRLKKLGLKSAYTFPIPTVALNANLCIMCFASLPHLQDQWQHIHRNLHFPRRAPASNRQRNIWQWTGGHHGQPSW